MAPAIDRHRKYNRDGCGGLPDRRHRASDGDNDVHLEANELRRDLRVALLAAFRPPILDGNRAAVDPAEFTQPRHERGRPWSKSRRVCPEKADRRQLSRLLRMGRERPDCRAADACYEFAPPHASPRQERAA